MGGILLQWFEPLTLKQGHYTLPSEGLDTWQSWHKRVAGEHERGYTVLWVCNVGCEVEA